MNDERDTHGLEADMRIVLANSETDERGEIISIDTEAGTAWVEWDNGYTSDVDVDEIIPEGGW